MDIKPPTLTSHKIRILLVDDQKIIGLFVQRALDGNPDIDFFHCLDSAQAMKMVAKTKPTVIFQDMIMPDVDGLTMVKLYRSSPFSRNIPIIVLSGQEDASIKAQAFGAGANDYMVKPFEKLELLARVRHHSQGYINLLQRNEAFKALENSQKQLEVRNQFIRNTFGRYLSDEIVDTILDSPEGMKLGGEKREVTIMMTDLRGFTAISERLPPEDVVTIINSYLEVMTNIILKYNGTIDEFIGDAILVIFGAPIVRSNDPARAVACALEMQLAMGPLNEKNRALGFPHLEMGAGINTGPVVVGNIGCTKRTKYGVVGQHVNLTSRIESYTVGGQILISESTLRPLGRTARVDGHMEVMPKGVKRPIFLYEIGGLAGKFKIFLPKKVEISLTDLSKKLPVSFTILESKFATKQLNHGVIVGLAESAAQIQVEGIEIKKLDNLKLSLFNFQGKEITDELYGKVAKDPIQKGSSTLFLFIFTAVPNEAKVFIKQLLKK